MILDNYIGVYSHLILAEYVHLFNRTNEKLNTPGAHAQTLPNILKRKKFRTTHQANAKICNIFVFYPDTKIK